MDRCAGRVVDVDNQLDEVGTGTNPASEVLARIERMRQSTRDGQMVIDLTYAVEMVEEQHATRGLQEMKGARKQHGGDDDGGVHALPCTWVLCLSQSC